MYVGVVIQGVGGNPQEAGRFKVRTKAAAGVYRSGLQLGLLLLVFAQVFSVFEQVDLEILFIYIFLRRVPPGTHAIA